MSARAIHLNPSQDLTTTGTALSGHVDGDSWLNQDPMRLSFSVDLNPLGLAAVNHLLDAIEQGVEVLVVTDPDLVRAVLEQAGHDSPQVGADGATSGEPTVGDRVGRVEAPTPRPTVGGAA